VERKATAGVVSLSHPYPRRKEAEQRRLEIP